MGTDHARMTVPATPRRSPVYTGNGVTTVFPFSFKVFGASDIQVIATSAAGVISTLVLNSDYTVTLNADQSASPGGSIVALVAPANASKLVILGAIPYDQTLSLPGGGNFNPVAIGNNFDRTEMQIQQLATAIAGAITVPVGETVPALPAAAVRAGYMLGFDSLGNPIAVAQQSGTAGSLATDLADTVTPSKGAGQIGYNNALGYPAGSLGAALQAAVASATFTQSGTGAVARTIQNKAREIITVGDFGAVGDGVTDDTAAFNLAGATGKAIGVPGTGKTYKLSSQVSGLFYAIGQPRFVTTYQSVALVSKVGVALDENNSGVVGAFPRSASILMIGDSIGEGTGASSYLKSMSWLVGRSIMNAANEGMFRDSGFDYHSILNFANILNSPGVTTTGTISANGIWADRLLLTSSAQGITFINREATAVSVYYNASASSGQFAVQLNGVTVQTVTVAGSGVVTTGFITLKANSLLTRLTDAIKIVPVGAGVVELASVVIAKNSLINPCILSVGAKSGYGYQDYNSSTAMDEMAVYLNAAEVGGSSTKLLICNIGTNNMYNAGRSLTPAGMVTALSTLLSGMVARCTAIQIAVAIPPKSNESLFPMINGTFVYEDYVQALVAYCIKNNLTMIRHDLGALNSGAYYADGLHPNDVGHTVFAQTTLKALKVKYDAYFKQNSTALSDYLTLLRTDAAPAMNSTWGPFAAAAGQAARAHLSAGVVRLSGCVIPNGSASTLIGTLPAGYRPDTVDRNFIVGVNNTAGTFALNRIRIGTDGTINLNTVPTNDVALDGISFPIYKFIEA